MTLLSNIGNKDILSENLRYYVDACGKTQKELSDIFGVAPSTFNDWTKGKKYPRIDKIELMANYFGILKSDLIERKEDKDRKMNMPSYDPQIIEVIDLFSRLSDIQKQSVLELLRSFSK